MSGKKNKRKKNKRRSMWRAFRTTFLVTLLAGAAALCAVMFLEAGGSAEPENGILESVSVEKEELPKRQTEAPHGATGIEEAQVKPAEAEENQVKAEENPGETKENPAEAEENPEKTPKEEDIFDESGCVRDENGRILEKKQETGSDEAVLLFAGDILFDDSYTIMVSMRKRGNIRACFSAETLLEMENADIFMLNNEFTYTNRGEPTPEKQFTFRAKPENAMLLHELGVDIVSLANNHAYDYGEISLLDSLSVLEGIDMPYVGAGRNLDEASQTVYFYAGNQKIAYISGTQIERSGSPDTKGATESSPGVFRCLTETKIFDRIAEAKENSDFVIVYIHWGTEKTDKLDWLQPDMAKSLAEAGADLIIGDHPHVLQPLASVDGVPTIYSLGNYWFNSSTIDTCLVKVVVKDGAMQRFQFLPARQSNCYTELLDGGEKEAVLGYMRGISPGVTIDAEGIVEF